MHLLQMTHEPQQQEHGPQRSSTLQAINSSSLGPARSAGGYRASLEGLQGSGNTGRPLGKHVTEEQSQYGAVKSGAAPRATV